MTRGVFAVVAVGPFEVLDLNREAVVAAIGASPSAQPVAYALHVGGLNHRQDREFVEAMRSTDLVYADGAAVVLLARFAGAESITRAATTDIGIDSLVARAKHLGRQITVAVVGGPPGLAERAGKALEAASDSLRLVYATDGFHEDYTQVFADLAEARPDAVVVGLGMPREAIWVHQNRKSLPNALILTCGGWLGFLAGEERRAPEFMQKFGLEWLYRVSQSPRRLAARYGTGMLTVARMSPAQWRRRALTSR